MFTCIKKTENYNKIVDNLERGHATSNEKAIFRNKQNVKFSVAFEFAFSYDWSNGINGSSPDERNITITKSNKEPVTDEEFELIKNLLVNFNHLYVKERTRPTPKTPTFKITSNSNVTRTLLRKINEPQPSATIRERTEVSFCDNIFHIIYSITYQLVNKHFVFTLSNHPIEVYKNPRPYSPGNFQFETVSEEERILAINFITQRVAKMKPIKINPPITYEQISL